jgi:hypothetical protein
MFLVSHQFVIIRYLDLLQGISGLENPDSQGPLLMCRPKFLYQETKTRLLKNDPCLIFSVRN